jgi:hypothetical protein
LILYAFDVERSVDAKIWPEWSGGRVRLISPRTAAAVNDNRRNMFASLGGAASLLAAAPAVGRSAAVVVLGLTAWWAATIERDHQSAFERIAATLTDKRVLDAGPISIADCGAKGCADASDTVYRFAVGAASCFTVAGTHLAGEPGEAGFGTGMLVVDERGRRSLLLLDEDLRTVVAVATDGVAQRPCPQRRPSVQKAASGI